MASKQSSEKQLYWQEMIDRQAGSGLSVRQFCVAERVSEASFYAWRRKLGKAKGVVKRSRTSNRRPSGPRSGREFIPLKLLESSGAVEVVHPLGYRIRVTGEVHARDLQRVLDVLDGRSHG
jgi:hypothetical protein